MKVHLLQRTHRFLVTIILALLFIGAGQSPSSAEYCEGEFWPYAMDLPRFVVDGMNTEPSPNTGILAWIPPNAQKIRAVFAIIQNSDSKHLGEHATIREIATQREMGIVYLRIKKWYGDRTKSQTPNILPACLDTVAKKTGIDEFRYAPWITLGKSASGEFPIANTFLYPERSIAGISYHGRTPQYPVPSWANLDGESIMYTCVQGHNEWKETWRVHVRPAMLGFRNENWLTNQIVGFNVGHGEYPDKHGSSGWGEEFPGRVTCVNVWDYLALFIDRAIDLRVPKDIYPTDGPVDLLQVGDSVGYLIEPRAEDFFTQTPSEPLECVIRAASDVPKDERTGMFWVPDLDVANAWWDIHAILNQDSDVGICPATNAVDRSSPINSKPGCKSHQKKSLRFMGTQSELGRTTGAPYDLQGRLSIPAEADRRVKKPCGITIQK